MKSVIKTKQTRGNYEGERHWVIFTKGHKKLWKGNISIFLPKMPKVIFEDNGDDANNKAEADDGG